MDVPPGCELSKPTIAESMAMSFGKPIAEAREVLLREPTAGTNEGLDSSPRAETRGLLEKYCGTNGWCGRIVGGGKGLWKCPG